MTIGTLFTLFVVPVFYSLIAADHQPQAAADEADEPQPAGHQPACAERDHDLVTT
jgi:multidrug efflux pump